MLYMLQTLSEFIQSYRESDWPNSRAYIKEPGFKDLYIRLTPRYINKIQYKLVLDIAKVEASYKGKGTFKKLIAKIRDEYPEMGIYVEAVLTECFAEGLVRMGFKVVDHNPDCFFMEPKYEIDQRVREKTASDNPAKIT